MSNKKQIIPIDKYFVRKISSSSGKTIKNTHPDLSINNSNRKSGNNHKSGNNRSVSRLDRGEHHFKIIHELLRAKLRETAPIFYRHYRQKLLDKILKDGRKIIKPASPGKSRTLKGHNAIPKYPTRLALIRDDYLSKKSPQELFEWWSRKLDDYGMAAENWHFTWPEIECGFYNQLTHLSNSFNKYPPLEEYEGDIEMELLTEYLNLVEQIVLSCQQEEKQPNYILIMDAQMAYVRLTQMRHTGKESCDALGYFSEILEKTKSKPIILLPQSIFGKIEDFIKFYAIPVVPFLSVFKEVHGRGSTPCVQINHDIKFHSDKYVNFDLLTQDYTKLDDIKQEFNRRKQIINAIILNNGNDNSKTSLINMFFDDIHERIYNSYIYDIFKCSGPSDLEEKLNKIYMWPKYLIKTAALLNKGPIKYVFSNEETGLNTAIQFEKYIHTVASIINNT